jgi:hypothetical protein
MYVVHPLGLLVLGPPPLLRNGEVRALINKQWLPASELGYGLGYAGVRVYVGYKMSYPYPNPNRTPQLTPGFSVPATIPTAML